MVIRYIGILNDFKKEPNSNEGLLLIRPFFWSPGLERSDWGGAYHVNGGIGACVHNTGTPNEELLTGRNYIRAA